MKQPAVHLEGGAVSVRETPAPARPPSYALIRMLHAGICSTDLHLQRGLGRHCPARILDQASIPPGTSVAVLGDGKLGLPIAQVLRIHGCQVSLYGRHRHKMALVEPALELLAGDKLILTPMIQDRFPLAKAPEAFARAAEKGVLKVLLDN
ncbi:MAG: hypothetical protein HY235_19495 [Acidobacteria bacterium]|nr:hypothetical protein [Acidobacteriota bacterium]